MRIQIKDISTYTVPPRFLEDGRLFLDSEGFELRRWKTLQELSDGDIRRGEAVLGGELLSTQVNDLILGSFRDHNIMNQDYQPIEVIVYDESGILPFDELAVLEIFGDELNEKYEVRITTRKLSWEAKAKDAYLYQMNLGTIPLDKDKIVALWQRNGIYTEDQSILPWDGRVNFPPVHYGEFLRSETTLVEDLRPLHNLFFLLEYGFRQIGYKFSSPFFESDYGRSLHVYLLSGEYLEDISKDKKKFFATISNQRNFEVIKWAEEQDNGNNYDPTTGYFTGVGEFNFLITGKIGADGGVPGEETGQGAKAGVITVWKRDYDGNSEEIGVYQATPEPGESGEFYFELRVEKISLLPGEVVFVRLESSTLAGLTGNFTNETIKGYHQKGELLNIAQIIDKDLTLLQLVKAAQHIVKGKIELDQVTNTVTLYAPFDSEIDGNALEGYFRNTVRSMVERTVRDSRVTEIEAPEIKRYKYLAFQRSSDAFIKSKEFSKDQEPLSNLIDFGEKYIAGREEDRNPLFQPTLNSPDKFVPGANGGVPMDIPIFWDNDDFELSTNIGFRILRLQYKFQAYRKLDGTYQQVVFNFEGTSYGKYLYAYQIANNYVSDNAVAWSRLTDVVGYGNSSTDWYNLHWKRELFEQLKGVKDNYEVFMDRNDYALSSFRDLYQFYENGRTYLARLLEIQDHSVEKERAFVSVRPVLQSAETALPDFPEFRRSCQNFPGIILNPDIINDQVSASADNSDISSTIDTDTWEFSIDQGVTFNTYVPGNNITGQQRVVFRRTITYVGTCPSTVVVEVYQLTCNNSGSIQFNYNETTDELTALGVDGFNSVVNTDTWTVSLDGATATSYTPGSPVTFTATAAFNRVVSFIGPCPDLTINRTYVKEVSTQCDNSPELELVIVDNCMTDFLITGTHSTIHLTTFTVSKNGGRFLPWDGKPIKCENNTIVRAVVFYQNGCPVSKIEKAV